MLMCLINHWNEVYIFTQINLCGDHYSRSSWKNGPTKQFQINKWHQNPVSKYIYIFSKYYRLLPSTSHFLKKKKKSIACQSLRKCSFIWHFNKWNTALQIHLTLLKQLLKFVPSGHVCSVPQEACRLKQ